MRLIPNENARPSVEVLTDGLLKQEQANGISLKRLEELNIVLFGEDEEEDE